MELGGGGNMSDRRALLQTTMLAGVLGGAYFSAQAATGAELVKTPAAPAPYYYNSSAVDGLNGKIEGLAGSLAHYDLYGSRAAVSFPLSALVGIQIDGAGGSLDGLGFGSVGGHLFLRNPSIGLIGAYVSYTNWDRFGGVAATQTAGEFELYWGSLTLQGIAGVEFGSSSTFATTTTTVVPPGIGVAGGVTTTTALQSYDVESRFFNQVNLKYYLTENWDAYIGHRYLGGENALALGTELALPLGGGVLASAFVEGRVGSNEFQGVWGGLRFYFGGKDKPLIRRHREDDPVQWDTLFSIVNNSNQNLLQSTQGIAPLPPPPPPPPQALPPPPPPPSPILD